MRNILTLGTALALTLSLAACTETGGEETSAPDRDVAAIHSAALTLDTPYRRPLDLHERGDPGGETDLQGDLPDIETGELDAAFFIVYTPQGDLTPEGFEQAKRSPISAGQPLI